MILFLNKLQIGEPLYTTPENKLPEKKILGAKVRDRMVKEIIRMAKHLNKPIDIKCIKNLDDGSLEKLLTQFRNNMVSSTSTTSTIIPNNNNQHIEKKNNNNNVDSIKEPNDFSHIQDNNMDDIIEEILELSDQLGENIDSNFLEMIDPDLLDEELCNLRTRLQNKQNKNKSNYYMPNIGHNNFDHNFDHNLKEQIINNLVEKYDMLNIEELNDMDIQSLTNLERQKSIEHRRQFNIEPMLMNPGMGFFNMPFSFPIMHHGTGLNDQTTLDESLKTDKEDKEKKELKRKIENEALSQFANDEWINQDKLETICACKEMKTLKQIEKKCEEDCTICCTGTKIFYTPKCGHEICKNCWANNVNAVPYKQHNNTCTLCNNSDIDNTHWLKICTTCKINSSKTKWKSAKCPICNDYLIS